mmetsp:Transcript_26185/g.43852  ORF Transcript_26185/g.43852 Transcript_26185/m.43852 type:complete len:300 (+) Transcript_26185:63-962(+)
MGVQCSYNVRHKVKLSRPNRHARSSTEDLSTGSMKNTERSEPERKQVQQYSKSAHPRERRQHTEEKKQTCLHKNKKRASEKKRQTLKLLKISRRVDNSPVKLEENYQYLRIKRRRYKSAILQKFSDLPPPSPNYDSDKDHLYGRRTSLPLKLPLPRHYNLKINTLKGMSSIDILATLPARKIKSPPTGGGTEAPGHCYDFLSEVFQKNPPCTLRLNSSADPISERSDDKMQKKSLTIKEEILKPVKKIRGHHLLVSPVSIVVTPHPPHAEVESNQFQHNTSTTEEGSERSPSPSPTLTQ